MWQVQQLSFALSCKSVLRAACQTRHAMNDCLLRESQPGKIGLRPHTSSTCAAKRNQLLSYMTGSLLSAGLFVALLTCIACLTVTATTNIHRPNQTASVLLHITYCCIHSHSLQEYTRTYGHCHHVAHAISLVGWFKHVKLHSLFHVSQGSNFLLLCAAVPETPGCFEEPGENGTTNVRAASVFTWVCEQGECGVYAPLFSQYDLANPHEE